MAQEIEHMRRQEATAPWPGQFSSHPSELSEQAFRRNDDSGLHSIALSGALLDALGDEPSRRILYSAIATGKTIEGISAEQALPLSTCYRRVRHFVEDGLMLLERTVVTRAGKRYGLYRTSFSKATICFDGGEISVEVTPNPDMVDKLRRRWLSAMSPAPAPKEKLPRRGTELHPDSLASSPFE